MCGLTPNQRGHEYVSCFHPLFAEQKGFTENGKPRYIPVKLDQQNFDFQYSKEILRLRKETDNKAIWIPCGRCIGCRLDKSREWALRCMMELKTCENGLASFITLTYNESSVPISYYPDPDTGEALPSLTLRLDDLQKFWKRLRKSIPDKKIRYFACGEYGSETWRPHYHAIIFGYKPDDLVKTQQNDTNAYFSSKTLQKIWTYGNVIVAGVNFDTCAYVARYTAKKACTLGDEFYEKFNLEKPFLVMSRRPGIGWSYFKEKESTWKNDRIYISGPDPVDGNIPRSFLQKLEELDPEVAQYIHNNRELKETVYERAIVQSAKVPYSKLLKDSEEYLLRKSKAISRNKL